MFPEMFRLHSLCNGFGIYEIYLFRIYAIYMHISILALTFVKINKITKYYLNAMKPMQFKNFAKLTN
jgi:hypothetical protein